MESMSLFGDFSDQVDHPAGISPFVVVPGEDLDHVAVSHLGEGRVDDAGMGIGHEVDGDEGIRFILHDTLQFPFGCGPESGIDLIRRCVFFKDGHEVDNGHVGSGYADGDAVDFALEFRDDEPYGLGGAGGGRNLDTAAARARRRSVWGRSRIRWSLV